MILLHRLARSAPALALATLAWTAGCATAPVPAIEPAFAARTYTPVRVALLPPDVFVVLDQVGDNDPGASEELRRAVIDQTAAFAVQALRQRGYDVDLSARWDGVWAQDGTPLVSGDELGAMANSVLQFANGPAGAQQGPLPTPQLVAPELAAKIGWATQSDALLYVNVKGVTQTSGKRTAQVLAIVFIVAIIALIVLAALSKSKGGGGGGNGVAGGGGGGRSVIAAPAMRGTPGGGRAAPTVRGVPGGGMGGGGPPRVGPPPVGRGGVIAGGGRAPGRVYTAGPRVSVGVGFYVPLGGPVYTHDGAVEHDDEAFGGDQLYVSMTLVNAGDGRVLWHLRDELDLEADDPKDVDAMVRRFVGSMPMRGDLAEPKR